MTIENEIKTQAEVDQYRSSVAAAEWGGDNSRVSVPVEKENDTELDPLLDKQLDDEVVEGEEGDEVQDDIDPFAGVDPAVRSIIEGMTKKLDSLNTIDYRLKQAENRVGSLQNVIQNTPTPKKPETKANTAPNEEQIAAAAKNDKAWSDLKEEYPEWQEVLDVIEQRIAGKPAEPSVDIASMRAELETDFSKKLTDLQAGFEIRLVGVKHKDWQQIVNSEEYATWLSSQAPEIQHKANYSERAEDAIDVLDNFVNRKKSASEQKDAESIQQKRDKRLANSQTVRGSGKAIKTKSVDDMTNEEYREYLSRNPNKI